MALNNLVSDANNENCMQTINIELEQLPTEVPQMNIVDYTDIVSLYSSWNFSKLLINHLINFGITSKEILINMDYNDVNAIFPTRELIGNKIFFRTKLNEWRESLEVSLITILNLFPFSFYNFVNYYYSIIH